MSGAALAVSGELTIFTAAEWWGRLSDALTAFDDLLLDLSAVTEMDSAGLQLLIACRRQALSRQHAFRLTATSPAVDDLLALCDLSGFFERQAETS